MFYGWIIVALSFVVQMIASGNRFVMGILVQPMQQETGWTYSSISLAIAIFMLGYGLLQPLVGLWTDRYGGRSVVAVGLSLMGLGFLWSGRATAPWELFVAWGLVSAAGYSSLTSVVFSALVQRWFVSNHRGRALGIANVGQAVAQIALVPLVVLVAASFGWRYTLQLTGSLLLTLVPLVWIWLKEPPPALDGGGARAAAPPFAYLAEEGRSFWRLLLGFFGCGFTMIMMVTHLPGMFASLGLAKGQIALLMSLLGVSNLVGTVLVSSLSDHFGRKYLLAGLYATRALMITGFLALPTPWMPYLFAVAFGSTWIGTAPLTSALIGDFYGRNSVGRLFGWCFFAHQIGGSLGSFLGGLAIDLTGSYTYPLLLSVTVSTLAAASAYSVPEHQVRPVSAPQAAPGH